MTYSRKSRSKDQATSENIQRKQNTTQFVDNRSATHLHQQQQQMMAASSQVTAQRALMSTIIGATSTSHKPLQRAEAEEELQMKTMQRVEEEEPLQGKFETAQLSEEEDPLQGKFETAQLVEEEEPLQGKLETAQLVEEEEPLQGKFETAQLVEEEEPLQGKFETTQRVEEEEPLQGKFETAQRAEEEELVQGKFSNTAEKIQRKENSTANNAGLPDNLKSGIENMSGYSMDDVKVHYNSDKPAQMQAHAYAQGTDIHVAPGQEQHLPHEAWHVVQQKQGRVNPTTQAKGVAINDDVGLEAEADVMGDKAVVLGADNSAAQLKKNDGLGISSEVSQRMVAVAGGQNTFNKKDFTQLAHIDWAMKISGGPLVDLNASISAIGQTDDLHLVQHGGKGEMVHQIKDTPQWKSIGAAEIAQLFIQHLPQDYTGRIRVSSCYSGTLTDISDKDSALVSQIKALLVASQRADLHNVTIVGWNGPTITNINLNSDSGTGAETVDDQQVQYAGALQDQLLDGKYKALKTKWEQDVGKDVRSLDILAAAAAKEFSAFYQEFTEECKKNGLLLNYVESLVIA